MIVDVAVPLRVNGTFHYEADDLLGAELKLGSVVEVPFRNRPTHAFVLGFPEKTEVEAHKMRAIHSVLSSDALFDEAMLRFLTWVSEYYCHPLGEVLSAAIPRQSWAAENPRARKSKSDASAIEGLLTTSAIRPELTEEQMEVVDAVLTSTEAKPFLLHGVTGSGKTEVYMRILEKVLEEDKGAIILVPEIALTPQLLGRFSSRFPDKVAVLHSDLTPREKQKQWKRLREGTARVVVGARSAVFAPIKNLGLIVVDEEHEASFKQEDSVRYHARDVAIVRAKLTGAKIILGSATPSLESLSNAKVGRFALLRLTKRVQERPLPTTQFVDLKNPDEKLEGEVSWLSRTLHMKIQSTLKQGNQALLYLNRLGYAHFLFCKDCGHTLRCKNCDVALTYYRYPPSLRCHYCGAHKRPPTDCEECHGTHMENMGFGTEQVEISLSKIFPHARIARLDRSVVKTRKELEAVLTAVAKREIDIVIGTQMVAKGHDFPGIALVGILVADASLNLPDFRAQERTFQMITQVSGRAGRAEIPGEVVIQTLNPEHPVLRAAAEGRTEEFVRMELEARSHAGFPPYRRLAMMRFQHSNPQRVRLFAEEVVAALRRQVGKAMGIEVLGPAEAPLARVKKLYRWHCLIKSDSVRSLQKTIAFIGDYAQKKKSPVSFAVDVDPISLM